METLLSRNEVCDRLQLGYQQSFDIVPSDFGRRIKSSTICRILVRNFRGGRVRTIASDGWLPSDLLRIEDVPALIGESVKLTDVRKWCKRLSNPLPHYRFNHRTIRVCKADVEKWLKQGGAK